MSKTAFLLFCTAGLLAVSMRSVAQAKTGCVSMTEVLDAMPETKKADSALTRYKAELEQTFETYKTEYAEQANLLSSKDTVKYTPPQLRFKRESLAQLLARIQGFDQEAGTLFSQRRTTLLLPIQKKAEDAIQQVSKENGYAFIFEKETLHVYPASTDILPLVKKKLGL